MAAASPVIAPLLSSSWALPAIGAAAGAVFNKQSPLQGALMGGLGGMALGPAIGSASGLGAASEAGASPLSAMSYGAAMPAMSGQQSAMLASQTGAFGAPGLEATTQAAGGGGLLGAMGNPMVRTGMGMMMQHPQQQPMMAQPMPQINQTQDPGSMAALGQGTRLNRGITSRLY